MKRKLTLIAVILGMTLLSSCKKESANEVTPSNCHIVDLVIAPDSLVQGKHTEFVEIYVAPGQLPAMPEWSRWINEITLSQRRVMDTRDYPEQYCGTPITVKTIVTLGSSGAFVREYTTTIQWVSGDTLWVTPNSTFLNR